MAENRSQIPIPLGGISRGTAAAEQPQGTSDELTNVRSVDPKTGRVRLSQRAGSTKLVDAQVVSGKVDEVVSVAYDEPRVTYERITSTHPTEWSVVQEGKDEVVDVTTDRQGNVYSLTLDGSVEKRNSEGKLVDTSKFPGKGGGVACRRIAVDELDSIYIASNLDTGIGGETTSQCSLFKFRLVERGDGEDIYEQQWELSLDEDSARDTVVDFAVRNGLIAAVISKQAGGYVLKGYIGALGGFPLLLYTQDAPSGTTHIALSPKNDIFLVAPTDNARATSSAEDGYGSGIVSWTPHNEYEATTRMHSWFDASSLLIDVGADVEELPDRRYLATTASNPLSDTNELTTGQPGGYDPDHNLAADPPTDIEPDRYFAKVPATGAAYEAFTPPTLGSVSNFRCLVYDNTATTDSTGASPLTGQVLQSQSRSDYSQVFFKNDTSSPADGFPDSDGSNSFDDAWMPGVSYGRPIGGAFGWSDQDYRGSGYTMSIAVELPAASTEAQVIACSTDQLTNQGQLRWAILYNHDGTAAAAGALTLFVQGSLNNSLTDAAAIYTSRTEAAWKPSASNDRRFAVLSVTHGGTVNDPGSTTIAAARQNNTTFRINGRHCGRLTLRTQAHKLETLLGHVFNRADSTATPGAEGDPVLNPATFKGFNGKIFEGITVLTPDDTAANNRQTVNSAFGTGWGSQQPFNTNGANQNFPPTTPWNEASLSAASNSGTLNRTTYTGTVDDLIAYTKSATTVERLEGYLAHKYGSGDVLPEEDPAVTDAPNDGLYKSHPFGGSRVPVGVAEGYLGTESDPLAPLDSVRPILAKYSGSNGEPVWARNGGGLGYGVITDDFGYPITYGPSEASDSAVARRTVDNGSAFSDSEADKAWAIKASSDPVDAEPLLFADAVGDVYWPSPTEAERNVVRKLARDTGATVTDITLEKSTQRALCVAGSSTPYPQYLDDDLKGPEYAYLGGTQGKPANGPTLSKVRLMSQTQNVADGASLRRHDLVVVGGGNIYQVQDTTVTTRATGALVSASPYTSAVQLFGEVFITDGEVVKVLNPRTGEVKDYEPEDGGEIPARCRIMTAWRGRLIFARSADNPYEITATELGNPYGVNIYPATPTVTQAWRGTAAGVGRAPDIVNAFIPMSDDYAIIGGDHSLFLMRGDPAAGGEVDTITDQVGAAYGNAWTKGPTGECYIFTSRGGVVAVPPGGGGVQRLSVNRIERTLQDLDLTQFQVRMVWDYRREGLIVCPVPIGNPGANHKGWFFEAKTGGWYEDEWSSWEVQPSALTTFDGDDPDDRRVILGCEDGYLRYIDEDAANDDGYRIVSKALIGPLIPGGQSYQYKFSRPQVTLASDQGTCDYELLGSDAADSVGQAWASGVTNPGRGPYLPARTRGSAVWVRLQNGRLDERWSLEDLTVAVAPAGRSRPR